MDPTQRLQIANRIRIDLMREIGHGVDLRQMLDNELYARDVLLVCQAFAGHELQQLGRSFAGLTQHPRTPGAKSAEGPAPGPLSTTAAADRPSSGSASAARPVAHDSRWLHPSRWFVD